MKLKKIGGKKNWWSSFFRHFMFFHLVDVTIFISSLSAVGSVIVQSGKWEPL